MKTHPELKKAEKALKRKGHDIRELKSTPSNKPLKKDLERNLKKHK